MPKTTQNNAKQHKTTQNNTKHRINKMKMSIKQEHKLKNIKNLSHVIIK
jgi:hypothetical protein